MLCSSRYWARDPAHIMEVIVSVSHKIARNGLIGSPTSQTLYKINIHKCRNVGNEIIPHPSPNEVMLGLEDIFIANITRSRTDTR